MLILVLSHCEFWCQDDSEHAENVKIHITANHEDIFVHNYG